MPSFEPMSPWPGTSFSAGTLESVSSAFSQPAGSTSGDCRNGIRPFRAMSPEKRILSLAR